MNSDEARANASFRDGPGHSPGKLSLEGKSVAVTGGAGFLGSHVVRLLLQQGCSVRILDDFSNGKMEHLGDMVENPWLEIIRGDVTRVADVRRAFSGCQIVIHLAVLCLRESIKAPRRVNHVIVDGTLNCLSVALEDEVELFLNCSSSEVYGSALHIPMDEAHPLRPETPYAAAKVAQDVYVHSYGRTYGLPWVTIRPFNMYGSNSHWQGYRGEVIPRMIVRAMNREPLIVFGDGTQTRDFVYVEDAARAVIELAREPACREQCVNFCSSTETSVRTIAELICRHFELDPATFIRSESPRPGDVARHLGDNSKFRELVGFIPQVRIDEGIGLTIDWFESLPISPQLMLSSERLRAWE